MSRQHSLCALLKIDSMKKIFPVLIILSFLWGCKQDQYPGNYPGARVSPYMALYDLRDLYRGNDVTLTKENMLGSDKITGVVVSDHSGNNLPAGLLVIQDKRRLAQLRGISINIGPEAARFVPGDSVAVAVQGAVLKRVDGLLQLTGVPVTAITKISSGNPIPVNRVPVNQILENPEKFESTLVVVVKGGFNPLPAPTDVLSGDKLVNDGFGDLALHTEAGALFAKNAAPFSANFYGIVFNTVGTNKQTVPQLRLRTGNDVVVLSSTVDVAPVLITGFMSDAIGTDGNYEYIQLMAHPRHQLCHHALFCSGDQ